MMASTGILLFLLAALIALAILLLQRWKTKRLGRRKEAFRRKAHERLLSYHSRSDHPKYEFLGNEASVVLRKEAFAHKDGQLAGTFVFLCRNALDEYFFCVIDISLSAVHIPKERALLFLKDFPKEYAAEIDYLAGDRPARAAGMQA